MGASASSPTFGALVYQNNNLTPDSTLSSVTKWRQNVMRATARGWTFNMYDGILMQPSMAAALGWVTVLLTYNCIGIGKLLEDDMANTINKRHGYENFEAMSPQDQARVKGYIRSEWVLAGALHEDKKYSPEQRIAMPGASI